VDRYDAGARTHTADDARLAPSFAIPARSVPRIRPRSRETCSLSGRKIARTWVPRVAVVVRPSRNRARSVDCIGVVVPARFLTFRV